MRLDAEQFSAIALQSVKEHDKGNQGGLNNDKSRTRQVGNGRYELLSKPDEYGKHVTTRETDHIEQSEKIRGIYEYARRGDDSQAFKSWARGRDVVDIDTLQQMKPSEFDGKPSVFKVYSAQVPDLDHWDMDISLGPKPSDISISRQNKSGAFWGVTKEG